MFKEKLLYPFYVLIHPINGFGEIKWNRKGSLLVSLIILLLLFLSEVFNRQLRAFPFNPYRTDKLNVLMVIAQTIVPFLLWVIANWCLCSLMEGEGKFIEIWIATAYSLMPVILVTTLVTIASNGMTGEEYAFIGMVEGIRQFWFLFMITTAMKIIHQYSMKRTLTSMMLTVMGMGVILFLLVLVFSLFQQLFIFLNTVYNEMLFRL